MSITISDITDEMMMMGFKATPRKELERQIMSSLVPKNEREHWAAREIGSLREQLAHRDAEIAELVAALETVIANAPEPYCAITRAVDAQCRAALAKVRKP